MELPSVVLEKTMISLQLIEIIESINTAMRVRKAMIGIDYSDGIEPKLTIKMPSTKREIWAKLNTRRRLCVTQPLEDRDLVALETDIVERLQKFDGALILVAAAVPNQKMQARLQVRFKGMSQIALTLMHCNRGSTKEQAHFLIPKALE